MEDARWLQAGVAFRLEKAAHRGGNTASHLRAARTRKRNTMGKFDLASYVEDGYVEDGYQKRLLEVEVEEGRWIEAVIVIEDVVMFWRDFSKQYRPQEKLPQPRNPFTVMPD